MGDFRLEVNATGGHGCQREVKTGQEVTGCGRTDCPDCLAREFVAKLRAAGNSIKDALLIHWPNGTGTVVDNLVSKQRSGNF
jgi:hypothetical protein